MIINKAGGLIYNRNFHPGLATLNTNDYLVLAGTFHGVHAITRSLTPAPILATLSGSSGGAGPPSALGSTSASALPSATGSGAGSLPGSAGGNPTSTSSTISTAASTSNNSSVAGSSSGGPSSAFGTNAAANAIPTPRPRASGLEVLESALFKLTCFQTHSGTKFLLLTEPGYNGVDAVVRRVYELWADYVMKNPFYALENPVRCEAFDRHLGSYLRAK